MGQSPTLRVVGAEPLPVRTDALFACLPVELLTDPELTSTAKVVAGLLAWHANDRYVTWVTNGTLEREAGRSRRTIQLVLALLERRRWIHREDTLATKRGQVVRLLWRRPAPKGRRQGEPGSPIKLGGAQRAAPGGATGGAGGAQRVAPNLKIRSREGETQPEEAPPTPEEIAFWRGVSGLANHPLRGLARKYLAAWGVMGESGPEGDPAAGGRFAGAQSEAAAPAPPSTAAPPENPPLPEDCITHTIAHQVQSCEYSINSGPARAVAVPPAVPAASRRGGPCPRAVAAPGSRDRDSDSRPAAMPASPIVPSGGPGVEPFSGRPPTAVPPANNRVDGPSRT